jgi:hypothetical protein
LTFFGYWGLLENCMSFSILGKSIILRPDDAANAISNLVGGLKRQRWDRSADFAYCVWLMEDRLVALHERLIGSSNDSLCVVQHPGSGGGNWSEASFRALITCHEETLGFYLTTGFSFVDMPKGSSWKERSILLTIGRSPHFGKCFYWIRLGFLRGYESDAIDLTYALLEAAQLPRDIIEIYDHPTHGHKFVKSLGRIPHAFHPDITLPVGLPVLQFSEPEQELSDFGLTNLTSHQVLTCFAGLRGKLAGRPVSGSELDITCLLADWRNATSWIPAHFAGPWIVGLNCKAKDKYGAETLLHVVEPGAFVPLDLMGLKGSGLIVCDALRKEDGWEFWFHDSECGSRGKRQKLRDELAKLSGNPKLFDRNQEFFNGGKLSA